MLRFFVSVGLSWALLACGGGYPQVDVHVELGGQDIHTTVDSEVAKYYLEHYLKGDRVRPQLDTTIDNIERGITGGLPTRVSLKSLTQAHSTDFAALVLWQHMLRDPANRLAQSLFSQEFLQVKTNTTADAARFTPAKDNYSIAFVPGWFYKSQPENGADFAKPRRVLTESGAKTTLVQIEENGSVERNADLIAEQILRLALSEQKIILVSASKAGPEVALALTKLRQARQPHNVKAWVNIGGLLHGSSLADEAVKWPTRWYVKFFITGGRSFDGIDSLTTKRSVDRARRLGLPDDVVVVNYVAIPLSGQVSNRARLGYSLLRNEGPNDGLTQIVDEIPSRSITIAELGLDHFFDDPEIHLKTVALARTVIRFIENRPYLPSNPALDTETPQVLRR
ncbi:MAG: hypothetical protein HYX46_01020 [Betaproteobacteria bacterium]|nr:hypothetical protein [Betaproteobacteria bacterium]